MGWWIGAVFVVGVIAFCTYWGIRQMLGAANAVRDAMNTQSSYDEESSDVFAQEQRRKAIEAWSKRNTREQNGQEEA